MRGDDARTSPSDNRSAAVTDLGPTRLPTVTVCSLTRAYRTRTVTGPSGGASAGLGPAQRPDQHGCEHSGSSW